MVKIIFSSADKRINISNPKSFKKLIGKIFTIEKANVERVSFIFCSDKYLLKINKYYLNHNYFTDVISFVLSDLKKPIICEIYLSVDRIKENAKIYITSYQNELRRVMIHGSLHICGYNDKTQIESKEIHDKENYYLKMYFEFSRET